MHSIESRFVTGPSNILFVDVYLNTFQPRNVTSWGTEGVNVKLCRLFVEVKVLLYVHKTNKQKTKNKRRLLRDGRLFFMRKAKVQRMTHPGT